MAEKGASAERVSAYTEGVPCWVDAQLSDIEAGKRFYGGLFGWTFEETGREDRSVWALLDGEPVAALVPKTDGRLPSVWTVYFAADDAGALAGRIRAAGGTVVVPPHPVADLGTAALVTDPQNAVFALWEAGPAPGRAGDAAPAAGQAAPAAGNAEGAEDAGHAPPAEGTPSGGAGAPAGTGTARPRTTDLRPFPGFGRRRVPGAFVWAELYTRDTGAANAFYGDLFHDALFGPGADPDVGRARVLDVFPAEMPPHFLVHFLVRDCEAALGEAARLGGRVQVPPFETSYGRVAVVSDGQGASFAVLQR
ncbi:VOC family protein [Streptomyces sp. NRRL F-5065]|uniref:VOC family protein n=1 Tax=Streptomyces sp. NRRL F-5065 TaxID=1463855 RepID=UPI00131D8D79|nr:VOC family protein [Streptomyces sp. NRRL F-5065]